MRVIMSRMPSSLVQDLRHAFARDHAVLVIGAGVSVASSGGTAGSSWPGLLQSGVARCVELGSITNERADGVARAIKTGSTEDLIAAADAVTEGLYGRTSGEYSGWLRETFEPMQVTDASLLEAIRALDAPVVTTNYDGLLESTLGIPAVVWEDTARMLRVVRRDDPAVLHLHGYWDRPTSVVLGISSYEDVLGDEAAQAALRALAIRDTLILVGFGSGLRDPNFRALRAWMAGALGGAEHRHFRLVREDELEAARTEHDPRERVVCLSYGQAFEDLGPYLADLKPVARVAAIVPDVPPAPRTVKVQGEFLEIQVPVGSETAQVSVGGKLAQSVSAEPGTIRARIPFGEAAPLEVRLSNAAGVGEAFVVETNAVLAFSSWHRIVDPNVDLFAGPEHVEPLDVIAVQLESFEGGQRYRRYFPTRIAYRPGQYVAWEWDMSRVVGEAYRRDDGPSELAWSSSAFFDGSVLGEASAEQLLGISLRPVEPELRPGERLPLRVIGRFGDDLGHWARDVTHVAALSGDGDVARVDVGPSVTALAVGSGSLSATYGRHSVSTAVHVSDEAGTTEFLGGVPRICDLVPSEYGLLIANQSDVVHVLRPNFRFEALLRINAPTTAASLVDAITVDDGGNVYLRALWDRSIYVGLKESHFCEIRRIRLTDQDATPMALAWKPNFGLVIADHRHRLWQWQPNMEHPIFWTSVPVAPIKLSVADGDLWVLGGQSGRGLIKLSSDGDVSANFLPDEVGSPSGFLLDGDRILIAEFNSGMIVSVHANEHDVLAEGLTNPNAIARFGADLVVANFGSDSIVRLKTA